MKTTIEISDNILLRSKRVARRRHLTLRSLVEEGLTRVVEEMESRKAPDLNPVTFRGKGLSADFAGSNWEEVRDEIYKGKGF